MSDRRRKTEVLSEIDTALSKLNSNESVQEVLEEILNRWDYKHLKAPLLLNNLHEALLRIKQKEHQSGLFKTLVASICGTNVNNTAIATILNIDRKSVGVAKRRRLEWNSAELYVSLH